LSAGPAASGGPPPRHPRFELTDGLRGIAAAAVIVIHVAIFTLALSDSLLDRAIIRLDVAFAVFFVLSAFLLYRPMIAHRTGGARAPGIRDYLTRRGLRIYPAYWVALTVLAIFPGLLGVFGPDWLGFYSLAGNLDNPFTNPECNGYVFRCGLPQTWSLTAEVTFYLALPLYALLTARLARGREMRQWVMLELGLLALIGLASAVFSIAPFDFRFDTWYRFSFLGNMIWIGLGLALAVVSVAFAERRPQRHLAALADRPTLCWAAALGVWLLLVLTLPAEPYIVARETDLEFLASYFGFAVVSGLIMIPVVFTGTGDGLPHRLLALPWVSWFGSIAFGIFLWHVTIAYNLGDGAIGAGFWVTLIGTVIIATIAAATSYYLIERPLMKRRGFPRRR
jgi:peptidoglycan/LPS O-acetylase OafA/YrhL